MKVKSEHEVELQKIHLECVFDRGVDFKARCITLNTAESPSTEEGLQDYMELQPGHFSFIDAALSEMENQSRKAVTVKIFSYGGCVDTALAIVGRLKSSKCKIITEGYGTVESAGTLILASGDRRRISKYASFMHHSGTVSYSGQVEQVRHKMERDKRLDERWSQWMADFSKKDKKFYLKEGRYIDAYWTPDQLLEYGIIDEIF